MYGKEYLEIAHSLGYDKLDLIPINKEHLQEECAHVTSKMTEGQKRFYIKRKMQAKQARQQHIFKQINQQIKRRNNLLPFSSEGMRKSYNPAIEHLLHEHQRMVHATEYHFNKVMNLKRNNELSLKVATPQRQSRSRSRSNKTQQSNRSKRSTDSSKERLRLVRERQKQKEFLKKQHYKQKKLQDSKKSLKAQQSILNRSRKIKTRSQISRKIAIQNKQEIDFIKNIQIQQHLQRLKFKIQRTEMIRSKQANRKHSIDRNDKDKLNVKRELQEQEINFKKTRYNQKTNSVEARLKEQQMLKKELNKLNALSEKSRQFQVRASKQFKQREKQQTLKQIRQQQIHRYATAQQKREYQSRIKKFKLMERELRFQNVHSNKRSLQVRRSNQTQEKLRVHQEKFKTIYQIEKLKQKLINQRLKIDKELRQEKRTIS